jgi:hypothetical protein
MTTALEGGEESASRSVRSLPPGKTRYPLYRRLGRPQGRSGQVRKISPPLVFVPRTVQPVASHYTDWATRPTLSSVKVHPISTKMYVLVKDPVRTAQKTLSASVIKTSQLMLYREIIAVCSEIHTEHINALWAEHIIF